MPESPDLIPLITLPTVMDERGSLTFIEQERHVPISIRSLWWSEAALVRSNGVVPGAGSDSFVVSLGGECQLAVHDQSTVHRVSLGSSRAAAGVPAGLAWEIEDSSEAALIVVLSGDSVPERAGVNGRCPIRSPVLGDSVVYEFGCRDSDSPVVVGAYNLPFAVRRVFYLYEVPPGRSRGAHAHRECEQLIVAGRGSFTVVVDDGSQRVQKRLDSRGAGLYVPPMLWASEVDFSSDAVCFVLASHPYDESDYIRNYDEYLRIVRTDYDALS
jgi:hypothetical protein